MEAGGQHSMCKGLEVKKGLENSRGRAFNDAGPQGCAGMRSGDRE